MILSVNDVPIPLHCLRNKFKLGRYCLALCLLGETAPSVLHFILYVIFMGASFFLIMFWRSLPQAGVYDLQPLPQQTLNNCRWKALTWIFPMQKIFHLVSAVDTTASTSEALLFLLELHKGSTSPEPACVLGLTVCHNSCPFPSTSGDINWHWSESTWPHVPVCIYFMQTSSH